MSRRRIGAAFRLVVTVLRPLLMLLTRRDWRGQEHLPRSGGFVICMNHISHVDPFTFGHFLYDNGHLPRYLAKASLFRVPLVRWIVTGAQQIPVYRETADAMHAYSAAVEAVRRGECVAIYPEGTLTRDPQLWPMRGKTGAARVALATGCPVIPVAQWGPHEILPPYSRRPRLLPRRTSHVWAGPPVDLESFAGQGMSPGALTGATAEIMAAITGMLAGIRDEPPPAVPWDPRTGGLPRTGNPHRRDGGRRVPSRRTGREAGR